ncbi:MAG: pyruvate dehydrogenase (acetyl-transferring), homodimeric type, partial [Alcanivoracaceae bacterium]|nr:pyruvate dehydrogenase (acetyl-transferring), homodimeric type [Alcanivoracaceae bacterium]
SYDPTFSYEVAVIIQNGLQRMYGDDEDIYFYITLLNENYQHPEMPKGIEADILKGMYQYQASKGKVKAQLLGSGSILREVIAASEMLKKDFKVDCDIWSCPSFTELKRNGQSVDRHNRLNPGKKARVSHVTKCLANAQGPVIAASDYVHDFVEQIRPWVKADYTTLGTDGFGRSDTREQLRSFFEVDSKHIAFTTVTALVKSGDLPKSAIAKALKLYEIDASRPDPVGV